jgi:hypothetical protein
MVTEKAKPMSEGKLDGSSLDLTMQPTNDYWGDGKALMRGVATCVGCFVLVATAHAQGEKDTLKFLIAGMRQERARLNSGVCQIRGTISRKDVNKPAEEFMGELQILAAFEGAQSFRFDRSQPGLVSDPATKIADPKQPERILKMDRKRGTITIKYARNQTKVAQWFGPEAAHISVIANTGQRYPHGWGIFDVRGLGLYYQIALEREDDFQKLLEGYSKFSPMPVIERSDPQTWIVTWGFPDDTVSAEFRLWIDVEHGFTPIRFLSRDHYHKKVPPEWRIMEESQTTWKQMGGTWVPVHHESKVSPGYVAESSFDITWAKVNESLDPKLVTYEGFEVPSYVGIVDSSTGQTITVKPIGELPAQSTKSSGSGVAIGVMVFLGCALSLGAFALLCCKRRRHNPVAKTVSRTGDPL